MNKVYLMPSGKFPMQDGKPVKITRGQFYACCCGGIDECLFETYNQHRVSIGQAINESPSMGDLQSWLETYCTSFINYSDPIDGNNYKFFTLATWRTAAGIDGSWAEGDEAKGFVALKWLPYLNYIENVRTNFFNILGSAKWEANGSGWEGYPFSVKYGSDTLASGDGSHTISNIELDNRVITGTGSENYVSMGVANGTWGQGTAAGIYLDTTVLEDGGSLSFSLDITLEDDSSIAEIISARFSGGAGYSGASVSYTTLGVSTSASLDTSEGGVAGFEFYPVVKPPYRICT